MRIRVHGQNLLHNGSRRSLMRLSHVLPAVLAAALPALGATCDRTCLKSSLDQYLQAVLKHDPKAAPLSIGYRHTENALLTKLGEGAWKSVTSIGKVDRRYYDPVSEQAAFFGVLNEDAEPTVTTVRIRVEDRKITEAEWIIARRVAAGINGFDAQGKPQAYAFGPDNLALHPPEQRVVPPAQRLSREDLIAITNSYFDGITAHDGSMIMAHPACSRLENGQTVAGDPTARAGSPPPPPPAPGARAPSSCASGLQNFNLQNVAARRFPVVDTEAQIVLAYAVFIRRPGSPSRRNAFAEWFVIDTNKIRHVYSTMFYPPNDLPVPNWPPYDGNFPLPKELAPAPATQAGRGPERQ
jgi:hypothetical protein